MELTGNFYAIETMEGAEAPASYSYLWKISAENVNDNDLVSLNDAGPMVELIFDSDILTATELVEDPEVAKTFVLECEITDELGNIYPLLKRKIRVGNRDECSPTAKLYDAEENDYTVSKFGSAGCWMTQNLRSTYTWQGTQKKELTQDRNTNNNTNALSYYYPLLDETAPAGYGLLYTWSAANIGTEATEAMNAFPNKSSNRQGICPEGWVIPSDYDWNQLEKEIATNPSPYSSQKTPLEWDPAYETQINYRPDVGNTITTWWGRQMKSSSIRVSGADPNGSSNEDGTGFNALLVGLLDGGLARYYGTDTYFVSSSSSSAGAAWRRSVNSTNSGAYRNAISKYYSYSVRCKKL
jgi:uncharacterized protein (TIGR02145 family)